MSDFKYGDITEKIIGAAFRVHNTIGMRIPGSDLSTSIGIGTSDRIHCIMLENLKCLYYYLDQQIGTRRVDFFVEDKISVELKGNNQIRRCSSCTSNELSWKL